MVRLRTLILLSGAALIVAAGSPHSLAAAVGGLWEVGLNAEGKDAKRMCLPDPTVLAQWEHRAERCTRVVVSDIGTSAKFHYTCVSGGFGDSVMTMITPRTLRVSTQGISANYPFAYTLHARRVGDCPPG